MDIRGFLRARWAEERADALAAQAVDPAPWRAEATDDGPGPEFRNVLGGGIVIAADEIPLWDCEGSFLLCMTAPTTRHVAHWHPGHVLAHLDAFEAVLAAHPAPTVWPTDEEAHEHCAHPAYEYETTEGQRKAWDYANVPPDGEGWERNVDKGYGNGWARFDYHEESYWRRLRPDGPRPPYVPAPLRHLAAPYSQHPDYDQTWTTT